LAIAFEPETLEGQSKVLKRLKFEPNFQQNLSEILPSSGWAQAQGTWAQMAKHLPHLWCHSQKPETQNQKIYFHCQLKDLPHLVRV